SLLRPPPGATLFPYTTLFRSDPGLPAIHHAHAVAGAGGAGVQGALPCRSPAGVLLHLGGAGGLQLRRLASRGQKRRRLKRRRDSGSQGAHSAACSLSSTIRSSARVSRCCCSCASGSPVGTARRASAWNSDSLVIGAGA